MWKNAFTAEELQYMHEQIEYYNDNETCPFDDPIPIPPPDLPPPAELPVQDGQPMRPLGIPAPSTPAAPPPR